MLGLGRRTGGNGHIPSSDLPPRQWAEKRRVLLKWILHCGSMLLYPTVLELHMLTDEQVTLTEFFMQNKVTTERDQWWSASYTCLALHFECLGLLRLYWMWEGGRTNRDRQCKMGQCSQRAAWRVQTGWEEKISRREAQPQGRLLERLWKFCAWGFYGSAEEAKLSLIWSGESPVCAGGGPLGLWKLSSNSFLDRVKK